MSGDDWDYVRTGEPIRKKRERLAEVLVRVHGKDSLRLLFNILTQPAVNEQRIARQISEDSEMSSRASISSVEIDGPANGGENIRRKKRCLTKQDALNHLSCYPSQWAEIGMNLIDSSEVDSIMNNVEAKGDEAAYIVEKWWSVTTDKAGDFSWEKLKKAIENTKRCKLKTNNNLRKKSPHIIEDLQAEMRQLYRDYCNELKNDHDKFNEFCDQMDDLPREWSWMEQHFNTDKLDDRNVREFLGHKKFALWNFIDHGFLGFLIRKAGGSTALQDRMAAFEEKVEEMCMTMTIHELIVKWKPYYEDDIDIPKDFSQHIMALELDPKCHSISKLQNIHYKTKTRMTEHIAIAAYVLVNIQPGCIIAIWLVHTADILPHTSREIVELMQESPDFYASLGISLFMFKDFVIHPYTNQSRLWNASREGDLHEFNRLYYDGEVDINHEYEVYKRTLLQCAAKYGHVEIVDLLLERGADIDYRDARGHTALIIALRYGEKNVAGTLMYNGANLDIQDQVHETSALLIAAEQNYVNIVLDILAKTGNIGIRNKDGKTALILAAEKGHSKVVSIIMKHLQDCGADIREVIVEQDINDCTALHAAAERGDVKIVQSLISYPEIIGITNKNNETALDVAANNGHENIVSLLAPHFGHHMSEIERQEEEKKTQPEEEIIKPEEMTQSEEETRTQPEEEERIPPEEGTKDKREQESLQSGEIRDDNDPGELADSQHTSTEQKPPNILVKVFRSIGRTKDYKFVNAAERGDVKTLKHYLEDKKYDPNRPKPDMQSWTALMHACKLGHVDVVKLLLEHGADPNIVAENGFSALILASKEGHYEVVRTLLDNADKPDIHAVNHGGRWGALMWACQRKGSKRYSEEELKENHYKIAKALIEAGANINQEAENGWTPLMQASQDNNIKIVKMLCEMKGIKLNHKSRSTWSALTTACRKEREEVAEILVDAGADITLTKKGGITALHIACYKGLIKAMKHMVPPGKRSDSRIDINVKDEWDMTPLMLAIKGGHKELTKYLVEKVKAEVNIKAMKYNQWSAIFFAIRNKDLDTYHLLVEHGAETDIKDEYENTFLDVAGLSFSDVLKKTFYKQLEAEERKRLEVVQSQRVSTSTQPQKPPAAVTLLDPVRLRYYPKEIAWRNQQRPLLISNQ